MSECVNTRSGCVFLFEGAGQATEGVQLSENVWGKLGGGECCLIAVCFYGIFFSYDIFISTDLSLLKILQVFLGFFFDPRWIYEIIPLICQFKAHGLQAECGEAMENIPARLHFVEQPLLETSTCVTKSLNELQNQ